MSDLRDPHDHADRLVGAVLAVVALRRLPADPALASKRGRGLAAAALVLGTVGFIVTAIAFIVLVQAMNELEYPM